MQYTISTNFALIYIISFGLLDITMNIACINSKVILGSKNLWTVSVITFIKLINNR